MKGSDLPLTFDPGGEGRRVTAPSTVISPNYSNLSNDTSILPENDITSNHTTLADMSLNRSHYPVSDDAASLFPPGDGTQAAAKYQRIQRPRRWSSRPKGRLKAIHRTPSQSQLAEMCSDLTTSRGEQPAPCRYVDPVTGIPCDTVSSRSYDLARHLHVHLKDEDRYERSQISYSFPRLRDADEERLLSLGVPRQSITSGNAKRTILTGKAQAQPGRKRRKQVADTHVQRRRRAHEVSSEAGPSSGAAASTIPAVSSAEAPLPIAEDFIAWMPTADSAEWPAAAFPIDLLGAPTGASTSVVAPDPAPSWSPALMDPWDAPGLQPSMPLCGHGPSQPFLPSSPTGWDGWHGTTEGYY